METALHSYTPAFTEIWMNAAGKFLKYEIFIPVLDSQYYLVRSNLPRQFILDKSTFKSNYMSSSKNTN